VTCTRTLCQKNEGSVKQRPVKMGGRTICRTKTNSVVLVRKRSIPTERPPLVSEVSANFSG
jgi:hypothetical protein